MYQTYSRRAGYVFGFIYMFYKYNKHRKKGGSRKTTVKLSTTNNNIERDVLNSENKQLLVQFFEFMKELVLQKNIKIIT